MADAKSNMNLGSRTSFVISDLKSGISGMRQETSLLKQEWSGLVQIMGNGANRLAIGGPGGGQVSSTKVAPDPVFSNQQAGNGGNLVFNGPSNGGGGGGGGGTSNFSMPGDGSSDNSRNSNNLFRNLSEFVANNRGAATLYGAGTALGMAQSTSDMVQAQLLMQRSAFNLPTQPGMGNIGNVLFGTGGGYGYEYARRSANQMAKAGAPVSAMDAYEAMTAAQSYGIAGSNFLQNPYNANKFEGSVAEGIAQVSNLTPGIGLTGTTRAYGSMQRARSVNMLRGVGIRIRDEAGNMKPMDQIISDLWLKICRDYAGAYGTGKVPSKSEVLIGFQPGNSMDSMVSNLFGDDPMVYMTVRNGLLFKAEMAAGGDLNAKINESNVQSAGMTTAAVRTFSQKQALGTEQIGLVSNAGALAYTGTQTGLNAITMGLNATDAMAGPLGGPLKALNSVAAVIQTLGGAAGGMGEKLMQFMLLLLGRGKAEGGATDKSTPYVVGEEGPELFIPKTDGVIIPNHLANTQNRHKGGGVKHGHGWGQNSLQVAEIRSILATAGFSGQALEDAIKIAQGESGYNPFALNDKGKDESYGLMQINMLGDLGPGRRKWFGIKDNEALYDPLTNAQAAYKIFKSKGYRFDKDWVTQSNKLADKGVPSGAAGSDSSTSGVEIDPAVRKAMESAGLSPALIAAFAEYNKSGKVTDQSLSSLLGTNTKGIDSNFLGATTGTTINGGVTFNLNVAGQKLSELKAMITGIIKDIGTVATTGGK